MNTRPQFKPLDLAQATDEQIEAFAARKGMPTLVRPATEPVKSIVDAEAKQLRRISLNLPEYVARQLQNRAFESRCTVRHMIMTALKKDGIDIEDADMVEDGRRER